jgi:hypothetical protein
MAERKIAENPLQSEKMECTPVNASRLWGKLLYDNHPEVTHIILAYYYLDSVYKDEELRFKISDLRNKNFLKNGMNPPPNIKPVSSYKTLHCAISSIVGTNSHVESYFHTESRRQDKDLKLDNPRSFVQFDLGCEINQNNLENIIDTLNNTPYDWYLMQSNLSYHAVIDKTVKIDQLPGFWGAMLAKFSQKSESDFVKDKGYELSESFIRNRGSLLGLRLDTSILFDMTMREATLRFGNFEKFKKYTYIDWGHLNHSLKNLIDYHQGFSPGTSYLRLSGKKDKPQPILVARRVSKETELFAVNPEYFSRQPALVQ